MPRKLSLGDVRRIYSRLRAKYFMDGERIPPVPEALIWRWVESNTAHAWTMFDLSDRDHDPYELALDVELAGSPRLLRMCLLHELTHMRLGPSVLCAPAGKKWKQEIRRLANIGAFDGLF